MDMLNMYIYTPGYNVDIYTGIISERGSASSMALDNVYYIYVLPGKMAMSAIISKPLLW